MRAPTGIFAALALTAGLVLSACGSDAEDNGTDDDDIELSLSETVPDGEWTLRSTFDSEENYAIWFPDDDEEVGTVTDFTWTFSSTCTDDACSGQIASSSGGDFVFTWDGTNLAIDTRQFEESDVCRTEEGTPAPDTSFTNIDRYEYTVSEATADDNGVPTQFEGTIRGDYIQLTTGDCRALPEGWSIDTFVLSKN